MQTLKIIVIVAFVLLVAIPLTAKRVSGLPEAKASERGHCAGTARDGYLSGYGSRDRVSVLACFVS